jgi:3-deoxy-D-manno-octulosonic-acid transferase
MNPAGRLMWWFWAVFGWCVWFVSWPAIRFLGFGRNESAENWRERLGIIRGMPRGALWVHGASVGEVNALGPFLRAVVKRVGRGKVLVSAMTATGKRRARSAYGVPSMALPMDALPAVRKAMKEIRPRTVVIAETELWPALIMSASMCARLAWVNGRISDRSFPRYRFLRPLLRLLFSRFDLLCVISPLDASRVVALGAPASRVHEIGRAHV